MNPVNFWVLSLVFAGCLIPALNGYRSRLDDNPSYASSYAQSRSLPNVGSETDRIEQEYTTPDVNARIMDVYYTGVPQNAGTEQQPNLREGYKPQSDQQMFQGHQRQQSQLGKDMIFPDSSSGRYDDGLIFKVQRKDGKLNVVVNDTIISQPRQEGDFGVSNRAGTQASLGQSVANKQPSRDIIFPDDSVLRPLPNKITPRCAESGKLFCTEVENYPEEIIGNALRTEINKFEQLFGDDVISPAYPDITQRIDLEPGEETLCVSQSRIIYPKAGVTKDNDWQFIVNYENYTQGIRVDECINLKKPCAMTNNFPSDYTTECKQQFTHRHLVSMNEKGKVIKDLFSFPSCCICVLKPRGRAKRST